MIPIYNQTFIYLRFIRPTRFSLSLTHRLFHPSWRFDPNILCQQITLTTIRNMF